MSTERRTSLDGVAVATLLACTAIWGLSQVAAKLTLAEIPPLAQSGLRSAGAALLLVAWAAWRGIRMDWRNGTLAPGLLAGTFFAAEFGCLFAGLQYTSASRMAVFVYLAPFVVALGMPLISRDERLAPHQWAGLAIAFGGVVWAFAEGFFAPTAGPQQWLGDALGIAAAVLWGATTLVLRASRLATAPPEQVLLIQLVVSGVALIAASLVVGEAWPRSLSAPVAWAMVFQIGVVTFASYLAWFWLVRHYVATKISAFTLLTPVFGLAFGVLLLGEPLTARLVIALLAVVVGIALVNGVLPPFMARLARGRQPPAPAAPRLPATDEETTR